MNRKDAARRREIIRMLCDLSRNGWSNAKFDDYAPLEAELKKLEDSK